MGVVEYDFRPDCEQCIGQGGWVTTVGGIVIGTSKCSKCNGSGKGEYQSVVISKGGGG